jgi:hypothetical protein
MKNTLKNNRYHTSKHAIHKKKTSPWDNLPFFHIYYKPF